jgi:hypothetical protein
MRKKLENWGKNNKSCEVSPRGTSDIGATHRGHRGQKSNTGATRIQQCDNYTGLANRGGEGKGTEARGLSGNQGWSVL